MKYFLLSLCVLSFGCLIGCKDITHVQTGYVADRDECRGSAENNVSVYSPPGAYALSDKDRNVALLQLFCECMKGKDWKVAGCPKPPNPVAVAQTPQPTVVVVQSPTAQPAVMPQYETPAVAPVKHKKKPTVCNPPGTCPAPADYSNTNSTPAPNQADQQLNNILQKQ